MSTRYFCDGCDQEVSGNRAFVVGISTPIKIMEEMRDKGGHCMLDGKNYHLCERCEQRLKDNANPMRWPRAERAAKRQ